MNTADHIRARAMGVQLEEPAARNAPHDQEWLIAHLYRRLAAVENERIAAEACAGLWHRRWVWAFGGLMVAVVAICMLLVARLAG